MIETTARRIVTTVLERLGTGRLTVVEGGVARSFGSGAAPQATIVVRDGRVWAMLARGGRGLAEAYARGWWESPDLTAVIRVAALNVSALDEVRRRLAPVWGPVQRARGVLTRNTPTRSRHDIAHHYDLGNDLFELMLDPTMMYSSAVFERPGMSLQDASTAKLERICAKLDLGPRDRVVEIGTGWGGFALHAARTRGCHVTTTTISREQREFAQARVREAGLEEHVTVLAQDYRELRGSFDKLVSVEMIEAVGWQDFGTFFNCCSDLLTPDGAMFLQAITIDDRAYEVEKATRTSFIRSYIFPNGCLPSLEVITREVARRTSLRIVDLEDITPHYALTLQTWRENLERAAERLAELGYDQRFQRLWRLYLSYCEAGFAERRIATVQVVLATRGWRGAVGGGRAAAPPATRAAFG